MTELKSHRSKGISGAAGLLLLVSLCSVSVSQATSSPICDPLTVQGINYQAQWLQNDSGDYRLTLSTVASTDEQGAHVEEQVAWFNYCLNVSSPCRELVVSGDPLNPSYYYNLSEGTLVTQSLHDGAPTSCKVWTLFNASWADPANASFGVVLQYSHRHSKVTNEQLVWEQEMLNVSIECSLEESPPSVLGSKIRFQSHYGCPSSAFSFISGLLWQQNVLVGIIIFLTGTVFLLLGVKLYRLTLFLFGLWSAWLVYGVLVDIAAYRTAVDTLFWVCLGFSCFSGVLALTFPLLGRFLIGLWLGLLITLLLNNMFICAISDSLVPVIVVASVLGPLLGAFCVAFRRKLLVLSTAFVGAYMMIRPISWYLGNFPNETQVNLMRLTGTDSSIDFRFWFYVLGILLVAFNGTLFQNWFFSVLNRGKQVDLVAELERQENDIQGRHLKELFVGDRDEESQDMQGQQGKQGKQTRAPLRGEPSRPQRQVRESDYSEDLPSRAEPLLRRIH